MLIHCCTGSTALKENYFLEKKSVFKNKIDFYLPGILSTAQSEEKEINAANGPITVSPLLCVAMLTLLVLYPVLPKNGPCSSSALKEMPIVHSRLCSATEVWKVEFYLLDTCCFSA